MLSHLRHEQLDPDASGPARGGRDLCLEDVTSERQNHDAVRTSVGRSRRSKPLERAPHCRADHAHMVETRKARRIIPEVTQRDAPSTQRTAKRREAPKEGAAMEDDRAMRSPWPSVRQVRGARNR